MGNMHSTDRAKVIEILTRAFDQNQSINFLVIQDKYRIERIRKLITYSLNVCAAHGKILISADKKACALVMLEPKTFSLRSLFLDLSLIFNVIGFRKLFKVLKRESVIAQHHPKYPFYYIWFIGVEPFFTGRGVGSLLLKEIIADAEALKLPIYLETSTLKNLPWYAKHNFQLFHQLNFGYNLFFMKRL